MSWTSEKVEKLKELWSKGHTASQIAELLGDTTRNAVIGKAHRLNLEARAPSKQSTTPKSKDPKQQTRRSSAPMSRKAKFQSILLDKNFEAENPKSLEELTEETCKWPIGHPNEEKFYFCGRSSLKDFSYCKLHLLYAYQPKNKKEDPAEKDEETVEINKKTQSA